MLQPVGNKSTTMNIYDTIKYKTESSYSFKQNLNYLK